MKAYLATAGVLFAIRAVVHVWRIITERTSLSTHIWELASVVLVGVVLTGSLSGWALRLFIQQSRRG